MNTRATAIAVGAVVAVGLALWIWKRGVGGVAEDVTSGAVKLAGGAATGVVKGGASLVGIPDTDAVRCQRAIADGNYWDASFYCTASEFIAAGGSAFASWFRPTQRSGFVAGAGKTTFEQSMNQDVETVSRLGLLRVFS